MENSEWAYPNAEQIEIGFDCVQRQAGFASPELRLLEYVRKSAADVVQRTIVPVHRQLSSGEIVESAQVVEAHQVIRVGMCEQDSVHLAYVKRKRLKAQLGCRVYQYCPAGVPN